MTLAQLSPEDVALVYREFRDHARSAALAHRRNRGEDLVPMNSGRARSACADAIQRQRDAACPCASST